MITPSPARPSVKHLALQSIVPAILAAIFFRCHATVPGWIALTASAWMLLSGLLWPRAFFAVERALQAFGRAVGLGLTWLLLVMFFFLCMVPLGWILRRQLRTQLGIGFEKDKATYWHTRPPMESGEYFQRQY